MKVNGYEVMDEPTREEFATYFKVESYFEQEMVAQWLGEFTVGESLTQDEFERLCGRFHKLDFSAEELDALDYELKLIIEERSSPM